MSIIVACYKWVLDEADIRINPDLSVDTSKAKGKISTYDLNAIEAAVQLASEDDKVVCLTYGTEDARKSLKDALSRGPDEAYWVNHPSAASADGAVTAKVLAAAIKTLKDVKLVLCGEGSADMYAHEVAPRLGVLLGSPVITNVTSITLDGESVIVTRKTDKSIETMQVAVPVVISVLPEIYPSPIPGLKMILAASKKPITALEMAEFGLDHKALQPHTTVKSVKGYVSKRKNVLIEAGTPEEKVQLLIKVLKQEGVLP